MQGRRALRPPAARTRRPRRRRRATRRLFNMAFTEQAALLVCVDVACSIWVAAGLWQSHKRQQRGASGALDTHPGQQWRIASAAWVAVALLGHAVRLALRAQLHDVERGGDGLTDALSCALCLLLLVS